MEVLTPKYILNALLLLERTDLVVLSTIQKKFRHFTLALEIKVGYYVID
jgi:hypothetical protein